MTPALEVRDLGVAFRNEHGGLRSVVRDVSFDLIGGKILGLAGESGCGKSTTALAAIGFPIPGGVVEAGSSRLGAVDLLKLSASALRGIWGGEIAYVAQDATTALNPLSRIEKLLTEPLRIHLDIRGQRLRERALELLQAVGIPQPERALRAYPHEFSGGQQQRIALAIALACDPKVLVLDEPTTGLDVTTQAQVVRLIESLVRKSGTAALFISHNLPLLATVCDDTAIMYAGEIVELARATEIYSGARHPYTAALADAVPRVDEDGLVVGIPGMPPASVSGAECAFADRCRHVASACRLEHPALSEITPGHQVRCLRTRELGVIASNRDDSQAAGVAALEDERDLLVIRNLTCNYRGRRGAAAVEDVSLSVASGEILAVVGESGSGKSTLLRAVAGLHTPEMGEIYFRGNKLETRAAKRNKNTRRDIQIVFQDPHSSLNPVHNIGYILDRPLRIFRPELNRRARRDYILQLARDFRLDPGLLVRRPNELSGGQKQRVALARAFAADPSLILCDEVVSALDVSVQASILELLVEVVGKRRTALLFVTHDLAVVRSIADRICVMRTGRLLETSDKSRLFDTPGDEYTRELLAAIPRPESDASVGPGRGEDGDQDGMAAVARVLRNGSPST